MLETNLESGLIGGDRKVTGRCRRETLRGFKFFVTLVVLFPVGLAAQTSSSATPGPDQGFGYGTGVQTSLQFAGESVPENLVALSFGASAFYDDNVLATNAGRVGDEALSLSPHLGISRQTKNVALSFDYSPFFLLYRQFGKYDQLNQSGNLDLDYRLAPRFILGLHDTFGYRYGAYPSLNGESISSGPISPTDLNQLILPYTIRTLSNMTGLDLTFEKSRRTSFTFSGGYNLSRFGNQAAASGSLYDSKGVIGSLKFNYRPTDHTSFGVRLLHQDSTYQAGAVFSQRTQTESALFSVESRLTPTLTVTVNGGPQYVHTLGHSSVEAGVGEGFYGAGGGSITEEVRNTALTFSVQRAVSDGGGLYASVISTDATFGVRRRLVGHWEADLHGGAARASNLVSQLANLRTDLLIGGVDFRRPLRNGSVFHISYDTMHELYKGTLPVFYGFDRNQVSIGFDFRLKTIPLAR